MADVIEVAHRRFHKTWHMIRRTDRCLPCECAYLNILGDIQPASRFQPACSVDYCTSIGRRTTCCAHRACPCGHVLYHSLAKTLSLSPPTAATCALPVGHGAAAGGAGGVAGASGASREPDLAVPSQPSTQGGWSSQQQHETVPHEPGSRAQAARGVAAAGALGAAV